MKALVPIVVWAYLVAATLSEVVIFYTISNLTTAYTSIGILAATKAVLIGMYFMHLKYEPRPLHIIIIVPVVLLAVLLATLVFSYYH